MVKIELIRGMSYKDGHIFATKEKPEICVEDMATAKHYADTGFFKILAETGMTDAAGTSLEDEFPADLFTPPADEETEPIAETGTTDAMEQELNSMTVAELKSYASIRGIDITGLSKKAELVEHISAEQKKADEARALLRGE